MSGVLIVTGSGRGIGAATAYPQTNIVGTVLCCREAIRRMSTSHGGAGGVIVNVGSVMARLGGGGTLVPYSAKAAVETLTFGLSHEVAGQSIRITGVSPGLVKTEMVPTSRIEEDAPTMPMKRLCQVDVVAEAVVWHLSNKASYVSGTMLGVTGGR